MNETETARWAEDVSQRAVIAVANAAASMRSMKVVAMRDPGGRGPCTGLVDIVATDEDGTTHMLAVDWTAFDGTLWRIGPEPSANVGTERFLHDAKRTAAAMADRLPVDDEGNIVITLDKASVTIVRTDRAVLCWESALQSGPLERDGKFEKSILEAVQGLDENTPTGIILKGEDGAPVFPA